MLMLWWVDVRACVDVRGSVYQVCVSMCSERMYTLSRFLLRPAADIQSRLQQQRDEVQHKIASLETRHHLQQQCVEYPSLAGAVDYKLCPGDRTLLACSYAGDVWLLQSSCNATTQLTNTTGELKWG